LGPGDRGPRAGGPPGAARPVRADAGDGAALSRLADLGDPALGPLWSAAVPERGLAPLRVGGRAWIGTRRSIEAGVGEPLVLLLAAPRDELVAGAWGLAQRQRLLGFRVLGRPPARAWLSARRLCRPLEARTRSVETIGQGNLDAALPDIRSPREVAALGEVADRMRVQLKGHIEERAVRLADEQRRARELEIARQIQLSMLP